MTLPAFVSLIITGLGLGLLISAPVGPVNILCIQYSLAHGFWAGVAVGFGALFADFIIAMMAAFGLTYISGLMQDYQSFIQFIGGLILFGFGLRLFFSHPQMLEPGDASLSPFKHLGSLPQSFLLTITNPGALLGIIAVVGSAGTAMGGLNTLSEASFLLLGLFLGAALWWIGLSWLVSLFRRKMTEKRLTLMNRFSGGFLFFCSFALIVNAIFLSL